ncbi:unnamed protein product [Rotaria sp. Silwood2]|nr:unnamed protein product [Rotaria sp. Silwood2]CAF4066085.1 unnamed protein product [Rotaria sp. Silwood2]CAF4373442.1 unnamed protein product [Rotaria sp. Silwood2]
MVLRRNCTQIPCEIMQIMPTTTEDIRCKVGGQLSVPIHVEGENASIDERIHCIKSPALELLANGPPYPSIIAPGRIPVISKLFADVIFRRYRSSDSIWALVLEDEPITYYPWGAEKRIFPLFDLTVGYDRILYHVVTPAYLLRYKDKLTTSRASLNSTMLAKTIKPDFVTSSVLWMNSNCYTPSHRTEYMKEFMSFMHVDAWGKCGNNKGKTLPYSIGRIHHCNFTGDFYKSNWIECKMTLSEYYPFTVAIENSIDHDYVTEKLWQALAAGSVPLYLGAPNIDEWLPCKNCIVDLRQFDSPSASAKFVLSVASNASRYAEFHKWREQPVPPKFQEILDYFNRASAFSTDCMVCNMAHSDNPKLALHRILNSIGPVFGSRSVTNYS